MPPGKDSDALPRGHARRTLRELFARDKKRVERFSLTASDLTLDYSKNHVNATTRKLLVQLAKQAEVPAAIDAMFAGEHINTTEDRAVLHGALRAKISDMVALETPGVPDVWEVLTSMEAFVDDVHSGKMQGQHRQEITDIVNIGIGGSDLGPVMASRALQALLERRACASTACRTSTARSSTDLKDELDPETTLFVICSKTFTTQETMTNARAARQWLVEQARRGRCAVPFRRGIDQSRSHG